MPHVGIMVLKICTSSFQSATQYLIPYGIDAAATFGHNLCCFCLTY